MCEAHDVRGWLVIEGVSRDGITGSVAVPRYLVDVLFSGSPPPMDDLFELLLWTWILRVGSPLDANSGQPGRS